MRSPLSSSSTSLLAPVRRVGVGGALLGCGTGKVLLDLMTGLESLLAVPGRTEGVKQGDCWWRLLLKRKFRKRSVNSYPLSLLNGSKWALYPEQQSTDKVFSTNCVCVHVQSCLTLCESMGCSPPGSSVHGIIPARTLEWVAMFQGIFPPQGSNPYLLLSCIGRWILYHWATWEAPLTTIMLLM